MNTIAIVLPLILEVVKLAPKVVNGGMMMYNAAQTMWEGVTADAPPTPEQQKQYDDAMEVAYLALMESTDDVKE